MGVILQGSTIFLMGALRREDRTRLILALRCFMAQGGERLHVNTSLVTRMDNHIPYILYAARIQLMRMGLELILIDPPRIFVEALEHVVHQMETPSPWMAAPYSGQLLSNA